MPSKRENSKRVSHSLERIPYSQIMFIQATSACVPIDVVLSKQLSLIDQLRLCSRLLVVRRRSRLVCVTVGAVAVAAAGLRTRVRSSLVVERRELALELVLLQLHAVLKLETALEVVQSRRCGDVQELLLNSASTCSRSSYVEQRLVYASRILDRTACRSSMVRYIRQSCIVDDDDWVTLRVVIVGTVVDPLAPDDDDALSEPPPMRPPLFWLLPPLRLEPGRLYTPEDVTARSICGGPVDDAWSTDGIEFMPTPRWLARLGGPTPMGWPPTPEDAPPLSVRLSDGMVVVAPPPLPPLFPPLFMPFALETSFICPMFISGCVGFVGYHSFPLGGCFRVRVPLARVVSFPLQHSTARAIVIYFLLWRPLFIAQLVAESYSRCRCGGSQCQKPKLFLAFSIEAQHWRRPPNKPNQTEGKTGAEERKEQIEGRKTSPRQQKTGSNHLRLL